MCSGSFCFYNCKSVHIHSNTDLESHARRFIRIKALIKIINSLFPLFLLMGGACLAIQQLSLLTYSSNDRGCNQHMKRDKHARHLCK